MFQTCSEIETSLSVFEMSFPWGDSVRCSKSEKEVPILVWFDRPKDSNIEVLLFSVLDITHIRVAAKIDNHYTPNKVKPTFAKLCLSVLGFRLRIYLCLPLFSFAILGYIISSRNFYFFLRRPSSFRSQTGICAECLDAAPTLSVREFSCEIRCRAS
jgi:hypothetical protein